MLRSFVALAVVAGATAPLSLAQTVPNLSGTWVLQVDKSDFGMAPAPTGRTDVIDHQEPKLTIKRTVTANGQENSSTLVYGIDGKPYKNTAGPNEITSTLSWEGAILVSVSKTTSQQGEVTITDRYELSADGKTLTQKRTLQIQGQELAQTMVLAKQ
jgi:hypothetical protein